MKAITVYCSSSSSVPRVYFDAAVELGLRSAQNNWQLVYGGNSIGVMQALSDAVRATGGNVVGVTPQVLVDKGISDRQCHELLVTTCMRDRKALMEQRGDAFVAMPGGLGTLEEIIEIIVGKQLGYHDKPIILLNINDFYAPLLAMIEHGIEHRFIKPQARDLYVVAQHVREAIEHLQNHKPAAGTAGRTDEGRSSGIE